MHIADAAGNSTAPSQRRTIIGGIVRPRPVNTKSGLLAKAWPPAIAERRATTHTSGSMSPDAGLDVFF